MNCYGVKECAQTMKEHHASEELLFSIDEGEIESFLEQRNLMSRRVTGGTSRKLHGCSGRVVGKVAAWIMRDRQAVRVDPIEHDLPQR